MPLTTSPSTQTLKTIVAPDRRIAIALWLAFILFLVFFVKGMLLCYFAATPLEDDTIQLQWRHGLLSACRTTDCLVMDSPELLPPEIVPFFFQPIPINLADAQLIETIDGIGPHMAAEILRLRGEGVIFRNGEDLLRVPGIGPKRLRQLERQFSFSAAQ